MSEMTGVTVAHDNSQDTKGQDDSGRDGYRRKRPRPPVDLILDYKDVDSLRWEISHRSVTKPARRSHPRGV